MGTGLMSAWGVGVNGMPRRLHGVTVYTIPAALLEVRTGYTRARQSVTACDPRED